MNNTVIKMNYRGLLANISIHYLDPFAIERYECFGEVLIVKMFKEKLDKEPSGYFIGPRSSNNIEHFIHSAYQVNMVFDVEYEVLNPPDYGVDSDPDTIY
jgi:hypothetical protein